MRGYSASLYFSTPYIRLRLDRVRGHCHRPVSHVPRRKRSTPEGGNPRRPRGASSLRSSRVSSDLFTVQCISPFDPATDDGDVPFDDGVSSAWTNVQSARRARGKGATERRRRERGDKRVANRAFSWSGIGTRDEEIYGVQGSREREMEAASPAARPGS